MMKTYAATLCLGLLLLAAQAAPAATLEKVGVVDANRIISSMPEFQRYSKEYSADQKRLARQPHSAEAQHALQKWTAIRQKFVDKAMKTMQAATEKVQKDQHLAFVLVDAPWNPIHPLAQDGAEDVTTDVMFAMHGR